MKSFIEDNLQTVHNITLPGHHGDVIIEPTALPDEWETWPIVKDNALAYGEMTGHIHQLFGDEVEVRENPKTKERYFKVGNVITLKHQEHNPVAFHGEGKVYKSRIAREYDHFDELIRQVAD